MESELCVVIVDDDPVTRESLRRLLESLKVKTRAFSSAEELLKEFPESAGCIVTDVVLPGMSGLQLMEHLAKQGIRVPVIIMSGYADVTMAVRAMKAGAFDFVEKPVRLHELAELTRKACHHYYETMPLELRHREVAARLTQLTSRERQVMDMVVAGLANKQIGAKLQLSMKTVEFHRARVMEKMAANSVADLVRMSLMCDAPQGGPQPPLAQTPDHLPAPNLQSAG